MMERGPTIRPSHFLSSLLIALVVTLFLEFVSGAPHWAAVGFGVVVYLNEMKHPMGRRSS